MPMCVEHVEKIICRVGEFTRNAKGLLELVSLKFVWVCCQGNFLYVKPELSVLKVNSNFTEVAWQILSSLHMTPFSCNYRKSMNDFQILNFHLY